MFERPPHSPEPPGRGTGDLTALLRPAPQVAHRAAVGAALDQSLSNGLVEPTRHR